MRVRMVIKRGQVFLILLLMILVGGVAFLNLATDSRSADELRHSYQVKDCLWLYITENKSGNATVPVIYRFYLADKITGNADAILNALKQNIPFLTGNGSISQITADGDQHIRVSYSGKVYSLSDTVSFSSGGQRVNAAISYSLN